jgi:hypothetical protein
MLDDVLAGAWAGLAAIAVLAVAGALKTTG